MKSKIFLTSMLVMVVACPAFATTDTNGNGTIAYDSTSEPCSGDTLTYNNTENTTGPVYYAPNWVADECSISLNANGGSHTASSLQTLYTRYDEGAYLESARTNLMGPATNGLSASGIPTGPTVTTTWDISTNVPINPVTNQAYSLTAISNSTPTRAFEGYWNAATNPTVQYIDSTSPYYIISTAGTNAAKSIAYTSGTTTCPSTTWYAKWGCATRTFPADPTITGYNFDGWYDSNNTQVTSTCTTSNETLYAKWTPHTGTITYNCGTAPAAGITVGGAAPSPDSVEYDGDFELADTQGTCALSGGTAGEYSFGGWDCDYNLETGANNSTPYQAEASGIFKVPAPNYPTAVSVTCYARWTQNAPVNLVWYLNETGTATFNGTGENPNTCVYGGTMGPLVQPGPRTGYTFNGWTVTTQRQ